MKSDAGDDVALRRTTTRRGEMGGLSDDETEMRSCGLESDEGFTMGRSLALKEGLGDKLTEETLLNRSEGMLFMVQR